MQSIDGNKFKTDDIVEQNYNNNYLLHVSGVIHDDELLFVIDNSDRLNSGKEFSISFDEVTNHWSKKEPHEMP